MKLVTTLTSFDSLPVRHRNAGFDGEGLPIEARHDPDELQTPPFRRRNRRFRRSKPRRRHSKPRVSRSSRPVRSSSAPERPSRPRPPPSAAPESSLKIGLWNGHNRAMPIEDDVSKTEVRPSRQPPSCVRAILVRIRSQLQTGTASQRSFNLPGMRLVPGSQLLPEIDEALEEWKQLADIGAQERAQRQRITARVSAFVTFAAGIGEQYPPRREEAPPAPDRRAAAHRGREAARDPQGARHDGQAPEAEDQRLLTPAAPRRPARFDLRGAYPHHPPRSETSRPARGATVEGAAQHQREHRRIEQPRSAGLLSRRGRARARNPGGVVRRLSRCPPAETRPGVVHPPTAASGAEGPGRLSASETHGHFDYPRFCGRSRHGPVAPALLGL